MAKKKDKSSKYDPDNIPEYDPDADDFLDYDESDFGFMGEDFDTSAFWQEPDFLLADIIHLLVNVAELEIEIGRAHV